LAAGGQGLVAQAMPVGEHEHVLGEVGLGHDLAGGQRVLGRQGGEEGLVEERPAGELRAVHLGRQQRRVQLMGAQPVEQRQGLVLPGLEQEGGQRLAQRAEDERQQVGCEGRDDAEPEAARQRVAQAARQGEDRIRLRHRAANMADQPLAGIRRDHRPARPLEQYDAEHLLQPAELHREGRLADAAGLRRTAEMPVLGHRQQVAQVAQVHRGSGTVTIGRIYRTVLKLTLPSIFVRQVAFRKGSRAPRGDGGAGRTKRSGEKSWTEMSPRRLPSAR
jgi:hypothetical protein